MDGTMFETARDADRTMYLILFTRSITDSVADS